MINKLIVKKIQIQMILDRGYIIPESELQFLTMDNNRKNKIKKLNNVYINDNNNMLYVYYIDIDEKLHDQFKSFSKKMEKYDSAILIGTTIDEISKKKYSKFYSKIQNKPIQFFDYEELMYNVTTHIDYLKHELIDKSTIIPNIVDINQLPILQLSDPIAKYYGWSTGDVIKITRVYDDLNIISTDNIGYRVVSPHLYISQ